MREKHDKEYVEKRQDGGSSKSKARLSLSKFHNVCLTADSPGQRQGHK